MPSSRDLPHLRLDGFQIFRREELLHQEIVVEAVLDDGADAHLHVREQPLHGLGQQVRRGMPDDLQGLRDPWR